MKKESICIRAHKIINERSEEKERNYGPIDEGMKRAANIFNGMTGLKLSSREMFKAMIALKLSRESFNHKEDNLLDAIAYLQALNNLEEKDEENCNFIR